jgi:hypothetical protein
MGSWQSNRIDRVDSPDEMAQILNSVFQQSHCSEQVVWNGESHERVRQDRICSHYRPTLATDIPYASRYKRKTNRERPSDESLC